jgi:LysM repeat protein
MRITNIKKFVRSVLIILGIILSLTLFISKSTFSHKEIEYKIIYVSKGDTLWSIAKSNQKSNQYYKNKDVRYIINDLMKVNNLNNSNININQELLIPIG